jgi:adenylate cyclase
MEARFHPARIRSRLDSSPVSNRRRFCSSEIPEGGPRLAARSTTSASRYIAYVGKVLRREVAIQAGVSLEQVTAFVDLGILRPADDGSFSAGDVRRARVVQGLERAGLPLEAMAKVIEQGDLSFDFLDLSVYDRFSRLSDATFQDLSARRGIPLELLMVMRETIGFARPRAEDLVREDELRIASAIELQLSRDFKPAVIERWLRVYGESLRRIAETEADWWHTEIEVPHLTSGLDEAEVLEAASRWGDEMTSAIQQALLAIYHAHQEHAWTDVFVADVESVLDRAGLRPRTKTLPAMCFLDISGYTRLTEERGDEAAADLAARLTGSVQQVSERHGGKIVKWLGDGVMFHFRKAGPAVLAALEMVEEVSRSGLPPARVGVHAGPVVFQGGDYFGRTVNIAARIGEYARPGEVLVSQDVVDVAGLDDVDFTAIGPVELKGVSEPLPLHSACRRA